MDMTPAAVLTNAYLTSISGTAYLLIDSGRTSTIKYTVTVHFDSLFGYFNMLLYTEFYYA